MIYFIGIVYFYNAVAVCGGYWSGLLAMGMWVWFGTTRDGGRVYKPLN